MKASKSHSNCAFAEMRGQASTTRLALSIVVSFTPKKLKAATSGNLIAASKSKQKTLRQD
ncbi:MAG: hypothetical protein JST85_10710 [Acidobacteria bacterium]|nr:hypothetical protein [Acidobacteriota bacterium]